MISFQSRIEDYAFLSDGQRSALVARNGSVVRYSPGADIDGLGSREGVFLLCSFWLADNWALQGHYGRAVEWFEHLLGLRNAVGLLSDEYDPQAKRFLGNFPQGFSHVALINSAYNLLQPEGPSKQRAEA